MKQQITTGWGRRGGIVAVTALLALVGVGAVVVASTSGNAETAALPGVRPTGDQLEALTQAAAACPALTPARLAGHVMAQSRFSTGAARGVAGLPDQLWEVWRPWRDAKRSDPRASIHALAHVVCDNTGRLRQAGFTGDLWPPAVAAFHSGVSSVVAAKGVPAAASAYVDRVAGFARWYALQKEFGGPGVTTPPHTASPTASVPPRPIASPTPTAAPARPSPTRGQPSPAAPQTEAKQPSPSATTKRPATRLANVGALRNPEYFGCLSAGRAADGTKLSIATCDESAVQRWEIRSDGTIRSVGFCMDAADAGTANFTPVQVATCSASPAQRFTLNGKRQIYSSYADKCVNIHFDPQRGPLVVLFSCLDQTNQYFDFQRR